MQTLYIDRKDTRLDVDRERILVHSTHLPKPMSIAFAYLSSIVISAKTALSSHVLLACASRSIPVIILDPRSSETHAEYISPTSGIIQRKLKQYTLMNEDERRLGYAKQLVYAQCVQQYKLLAYWKRKALLTDEQFKGLHLRLRNTLLLVRNVKAMAELRGIEGCAAKLIFQAIIWVSPEWCKFKGRNRRPPLDPINVLLSLSYSLIYAECTRALVAHALDPMLGFYHEPLHGRYSLSCDLTERLRTDIEKWVIELVLTQKLNTTHFSASERFPCTLNKEGRAIFYPAWEKQCKLWKKYIRMNVQQWAKRVDEA